MSVNHDGAPGPEPGRPVFPGRALDHLVERLVAMNSINPDLVAGAPGEHEIARYVAQWLRAGGLDVTMTTTPSGRPNVIARCGDPAAGPTLLLLGHTDTVSADRVSGSFEPRIENGRLHGRGAYDMKGGLAAAMAAAAHLVNESALAGEVIIAAVCDEEAGGTGTRTLLETGVRADAAIVPEPTDLAVVIAHKGYTSFEIETSGRAAHGSRPDLGVDAIMKMGRVLAELERLDGELQAAAPHPVLGTSSLHASIIAGGQEESTYPASALLKGECRTVPGSDVEPLLREAIGRAGVDAQLSIPYTGLPFEVSTDERVVELLSHHAGTPARGMSYWTDAALLSAAGIPTVLYGPSGGGAHADDEWVDLDSVRRVRDVLVATAIEFCNSDF